MAPARVQEDVLTTPRTPLTVRRVRVRGSNAEIGRAMAELAIDHYGLRPEDLLADGRYARARRTYFRRNYPGQLERMRGVAAAFGLRLDDDRFDFSGLPVGVVPAEVLAATATYRPPWASYTGHGILRRSAGLPNEPSRQLELYLVDWHPAGRSHASVALHAYDLLAGTLAGINDAGLAVAAVAADGATRVEARASFAAAVGLHELQLMRFVLDTCATVDQAQAALLGVREFTLLTPSRYLVAEQGGRSFVYEPGSSAQRILEGAIEPESVAALSTARSMSGIGAGVAPMTAGSSARSWDCVADAEHRTLEVSLGPAPTGI